MLVLRAQSAWLLGPKLLLRLIVAVLCNFDYCEVILVDAVPCKVDLQVTSSSLMLVGDFSLATSFLSSAKVVQQEVVVFRSDCKFSN